MKHKDLFWMLLPCLLLIGAAMYYSRRDNAPFQMVIDEAKLTPTTPLGVAKGYDTRLIVKTRLINVPRGEEPIKLFNYLKTTTLHLLYEKNGKQVEAPIPALIKYVSDSSSKGNRWQQENTYDLKLAEVPISWGKLHLQIKAYGSQFNYALNRITRTTPFASRVVMLRKKGQRIARPIPNLYRPFIIKTITCQWFVSGISDGAGIKIRVAPVNGSIVLDKNSVKLENMLLVTENGRFSGTLGQVSWLQGSDGKTLEISIYEFEKDIPPKARNIIFKADLSINECWPLPISVVLRKDGKNITRNEPAM